MSVERFANFAQPVLDLPLVRRTRRNHGLEHATITILSQHVRGLQMAGRSDAGGFVLLGEAPTEQIEAVRQRSAAPDARRRAWAGGASQLRDEPRHDRADDFGRGDDRPGGASRRDAWNRLPTVLLLVMVALIFSQPLGLSLQSYITTDGDPADLEVISIRRSTMQTPLSSNPLTVHRVTTTSS